MVVVKTLNGAVYDITLPSDVHVRDLIAALVALDPALGKCAVFANGKAVKPDEVLPQMHDGAFLVSSAPFSDER